MASGIVANGVSSARPPTTAAVRGDAQHHRRPDLTAAPFDALGVDDASCTSAGIYLAKRSENVTNTGAQLLLCANRGTPPRIHQTDGSG